MEYPNIRILDTFTLENIPDLDVAVFGALELFQRETLPALDLSAYKRPLIVGSGNAEATGRIIFQDYDAVFASESDYEEKLKNIESIDGVVLLSASGEKHAPTIAETSKRSGKHVTLITNSRDSSAAQKLDRVHPYDEYVFPKNREPYTYNTSTYMGMILGHTGEDPALIHRFIKEEVGTIQFPDFSQKNKFYLIVPARFSGIIRMLEVKFIELFGRTVARDIESAEYVRHATTVVPSDELFISFGEKNETWGSPEQRLFIPLPEKAGYAAMMAVGYYVIAQIQKQHPPHFKEHIARYTEKISKAFNQHISPIVE